mgnify:CR=1 FL=1
MPEPYSISLLNDSFPPLIDGVANTVVNYARELTKLGDRAIVVTPEHPDADDSRFPFPVARYPSVDTRRLFGYLAGYPFSPETLRQLKEPCEVRYCSDSQYVINGLQKGWAKGWKRRGWKKSDGSPALNPDLWAQALEQEARHTITYVWVKGHAGHPENERCDQLAVAQSKAHGGRQGT